MPSTTTATAAMATDTEPATSDTRVPQITRLSTSRPTLSVPNQCARPGRARMFPRFCASGSYGASSGAASATTMAASNTAAPNGASRARAARRSASQRRSRTAGSRATSARSAKPDSGIDPAIQQVDEEVADDEADRDQQNYALHERIVARKDRVDHEAPDAGQREDVFRDHRAADQRAELEAHDGDDGDERILQHVAVDDRALGQPFRARRAHPVLAQRLEQARAQRARDDRRQRQPERRGRQHQRAQSRPALLERIEIARDRQPAQGDTEEKDQQQREQEVRHADPEQRKRGAHAIDGRVVTNGGRDGERKRDQQRDAHGQQRELEARPQTPADVVEHGLAVADRATEVTADEATHPERVLHVQGPVEAELAAQALLGGGVAGLRHHGVDGIAGRQVQQQEDARRDEQENGNGGEQPPEDYFSHTSLNRIMPSGIGS